MRVLFIAKNDWHNYQIFELRDVFLTTNIYLFTAYCN
jgi:hypothetical protein